MKLPSNQVNESGLVSDEEAKEKEEIEKNAHSQGYWHQKIFGSAFQPKYHIC